MKKDCDVIIVGAGPAGSAAAVILAQMGIDVLLLDKSRFPREKVCGDGIVTASLEIIKQLGIDQNGFYPIHGVKINSPKNNSVHLQVRSKEPGQDTCIVPRTVFDTLLMQRALACGSRFECVTVQNLLFDDERVCGVQGVNNGTTVQLSGRIVIGADGVHSVVARRLHRERQKDRHRLIALRAYLENFEMTPHTVEVYLLNELIPGYLWVFPMGENRVNIGLGMRLDHYKNSTVNLESILNSFLSRPEIKKRFTAGTMIKNIGKWPLHLASQKNIRRSYNGALLAGDAGAWIDPLTGGGICNALITGRIAGQVAGNAIRNNRADMDFLRTYEEKTDQKLNTELRCSYWVQNGLSCFPGIIDPLVRWAQKSSLLITIANRLYPDLQIRNINAFM